MYKIVLATEKPFHPLAVENIKSQIRQNSEFELELLESYKGADALKSGISSANAIIIRSDKITDEIMDAAPNLKVVARAGAGYDNVNLEAASQRNVVVMNTPGQNANAVAELVFGFIIHAIRNRFNGTSGYELRGKKMGLAGFGGVARAIVPIAQGFGMTVSSYDPFVNQEFAEHYKIELVSHLAQLFMQNQIMSLHLPATEHTIKSINGPLLQSMPQKGILVNSARKEIIHESDLLQWMEDRKDVTYLSDIAPDCKDEMLDRFSDRCFFPPKKMGAQTIEANINAGVAAAKQIMDYFKVGTTPYQVNR